MQIVAAVPTLEEASADVGLARLDAVDHLCDLAEIVAKRLDGQFPGLDLVGRAEKLKRDGGSVIEISGATRIPYFYRLPLYFSILYNNIALI